MAFDPNTATNKELKITVNAVEASTYLMKYCAIHRYGDNCEKCIFSQPDGCAIDGAPYAYKPLGKKEGGK